MKRWSLTMSGEHLEQGETSLTASHGLTSLPYGGWVGMVRKNALEGEPVLGRFLLYLCIMEGRLTGLLSIRCELKEDLARKYGHIGYGVRTSERGKGYGTLMLGHALSVCREKGMTEVILGC